MISMISRHSLIASVQASGQEPLNQPSHLLAMAQSCLDGGAHGLRLSDAEVLKALRQQQPTLPLIGLTKPEPLPANPKACVYITPTLADACRMADAGASMVAMDATTGRPRPQPLADIVSGFRQAYPTVGLMADCATLADAVNAHTLGFDVLSTTLSGYTTETAEQASALSNLPDFDLLATMVQQCQRPVVLEGRVWTIDQVAHGFTLGAHAVIVGSAITRPYAIVARFLQGVPPC
jgi:N-acylglucosamine-6-phosphate 2-epimerase